MKNYIIIRQKDLPEDEGLAQVINQADTKEEAKVIINNYCLDGYFNENQFHIISKFDLERTLNVDSINTYDQ
jgi:hypothetical protein